MHLTNETSQRSNIPFYPRQMNSILYMYGRDTIEFVYRLKKKKKNENSTKLKPYSLSLYVLLHFITARAK